MTKLCAALAKHCWDDPTYLAEQVSFEADRAAEDDELRIVEFKEAEEAKKKDSVDLDAFYPSNYYSSILGKSKVNKI